MRSNKMSIINKKNTILLLAVIVLGHQINSMINYFSESKSLAIVFMTGSSYVLILYLMKREARFAKLVDPNVKRFDFMTMIILGISYFLPIIFGVALITFVLINRSIDFAYLVAKSGASGMLGVLTAGFFVMYRDYDQLFRDSKALEAEEVLKRREES